MTTQDEYKQLPESSLSPAFQELLRASFQGHAVSPEISADAYLAQKHLELRRELTGREILYLDICYWINLRNVVLKSPMQKPGYREILNLLDILHGKRRICCPVSPVLLMELMKQSDPNTRFNTARLMDRFSNGVCFKSPPDIARSELRHFLLKSIANRPLELKAWVWTKMGFLFENVLHTLPFLSDKTNLIMQKASINLMWDMRVEHLLELVKSFDPGIDFWERYATASNADAVFYRSSKLPYKEVLAHEKAFLVQKLLADELKSVGQEIWDSSPECRDGSNRQMPPLEGYSPWNSPSLQILAGISASDMITNMKFETNDMLDYRHAALAIPYCNAVCCDNPMATRLRNRPCEFGKVYGTRILGRAEELLDFLNGLTNDHID